MTNQKIKIKEAIVVEGRDDAARLSSICDANIIITHGYGISKKTWDELSLAYKNQGLIILTDPDFAGKNIRNKLIEHFPQAKQANVPRAAAIKGQDIGVENACEEAILEALNKAKPEISNIDSDLTIESLQDLGLMSGQDAKLRRTMLCDEIGIVYCNSKSLLKKLRSLGYNNKDLKEMVKKLNVK